MRKTKAHLKGSTRVSDRVLEMKKRYMELHNAGLKPSEIADYFELSSWTIYHYLGEIAEENGVSRDELLSEKSQESTASSLDTISFQVDYTTPEGIVIEYDRKPDNATILRRLTAYAVELRKMLARLDEEILISIALVKAL